MAESEVLSASTNIVLLSVSPLRFVSSYILGAQMLSAYYCYIFLMS